ncbi:Salviol synthase [Linum grandiflorum]
MEFFLASSSSVFLFTSTIIIATFMLILKHQRATSKQALPGPWKLPIIGNLHQFVGDDPHRRLKHLANKYGPDLMQIHLGELSFVVISSPEAAKQVMKTHDVAFASRANIIYDGCKNIGQAPYGEYWRQMRKIAVLELLSTKRVASFRGIREEEVKGFVDRLRGNATREGANLSEMVRGLTSSVTSRGAIHEDDDDDLMDVLLDVQENHALGIPVTFEVIKAVTLELFLGGIDTSSTTVLWTMSEMIKNPRVMQIAQQEVREAFKENGNVEEASLHKLNYLDMVISEILLARETTENVKLDNGYEVPKKTKIFVNAWAINRDSRHWADAELFHPERFLDRSLDFKGTNFHFIPFGADRRICPGITFGMAIVKLTLANLLFHFDWKLPNGVKSENVDMTESFGVTLVRKYPLWLVPSPYVVDNEGK